MGLTRRANKCSKLVLDTLTLPHLHHDACGCERVFHDDHFDYLDSSTGELHHPISPCCPGHSEDAKGGMLFVSHGPSVLRRGP